jgi:nicotinate-nucleotide adenylyltransferase
VIIGILGGTFDPIHEGHLYLAQSVSGLLALDQVWFMVAHIPPHKSRREPLSPFHRYAMTSLALSGRPSFLASTWELERGGRSFTVDTLCELRRSRPADQFCFVAGSDSLRELHLWKEYDRLLAENCFVFVQRPGAEADLSEPGWPGAIKAAVGTAASQTSLTAAPGFSYLLDLQAPPISSTVIRDAIAAGQSPPAGWLAPAVFEYIRKHHLYEPN